MTIEQHMRRLCETLNAQPTRVALAIDRLLQHGLVIPFLSNDVLPTVAPFNAAGTVAIVTSNRPKLLRRTLISLATHFADCGVRPRVIVIDGSQSQSASSVVASVQRSTGLSITYINYDNYLIIVNHLAALGVPTRTMRYGTDLGNIGCNRNVALLMSAGASLVMIDDDVICDLWISPQREDGMYIAGHADLRNMETFASRTAALDGLSRTSVGLLQSHGAVLGRSLDSLLRDLAPVSLEHACEHMLSAIERPRDFRVRMTFAGLAGDSAVHCGHSVLFATGRIRDELLTDDRVLATALGSREVRQIAPRVIVGHHAGCKSYCMGLDCAALLPPFFSYGRNSDGVFGSLLAFCDPGALTAHLPIGVIHDSTRTSHYLPAERLRYVRTTRLSEFIMSVVRATAIRVDLPLTIADRISILSESLREISKLPTDDFAELWADLALRMRSIELQVLDRAVTSKCPSKAWSSALSDYRAALCRSAEGGALFVPHEFADCGDSTEAFRAAQRTVGQFADFMAVWPDMWRLMVEHPPTRLAPS
jgi:hypothetical protein